MNKATLKRICPIIAVLLLVTFAVPAVLVAQDAVATRTLPVAVAPGAEFDVGIDASGAGTFGQVRETLPAGFTYLSVSDPDDIAVEVIGQEVRFTFLADSINFTYTVQAPTEEDTYTFAGVLRDEDLAESTVGGDATVTVTDEDVVTYDLTISVSPAGAGTTDPAVGTHSYAEGTQVTVTAHPASGYQFSHWSGDATGTSPTIDVTMDAHKSITANFDEIVEPPPDVVPPPHGTFARRLFNEFIAPILGG